MLRGVRVDLSQGQWDAVESGELTGPDSRRYQRRTTRAERRDGHALIARGAPLVLYSWSSGQLDWFDGPDASAQWRAVRARVVSAEPRRGRDLQWTAGRWEDPDGSPILLLPGHC